MTPGGNDEGRELPEDADLGPPIAELRDVSLPLADRFATRVRGRIERRLLGGDLLELVWMAPLTMILEFLRWPLDGLTGRGRR